ncbi:MAG: T9SS type A sorting domain-containing protein, partial [Bacteroidota bacterium]
LNDLKATSDGGYIFCGESRDHSVELGYSEGPEQQGWLVKVDEYGCLVEGCHLTDNINVWEQESDIQYFKAGPIPVSQYLTVYQSFQPPSSSMYQLMDMNGKVIEEFSATNKGTTMMLDLSHYPSGNYLLVLMNKNQVLQKQKIIKE